MTDTVKIKKKRTRLCDRELPDYTHREEVINSFSHLFGALLGVVALVLCIVFARGEGWVAVVSCAIYGSSLVSLYAVSGVYHGLPRCTAKKVMQVIDHCTIYFLIAGTYTPIVLCSLRKVAPVTAFIIFGVVWGLAITATVFTAIDMKKYEVFSMICYICIGWCILTDIPDTVRAVSVPGFAYLLAGGIAYTVGAVFYGIGKKSGRRYIHSVFHFFVLAGSILQFISVFFYVI